MAKHLLASRIVIDLHSEPCDSSLHLRRKETISKGHHISKAILPLTSLKHCLKGIHASQYPILCELYLIRSELRIDLFQQSQVLVGMHAGIDELAESSYLRSFDWILGQKWMLGIDLLEIFADGHRLDDDLSIWSQKGGNGLDKTINTPLGFTFLYSYDFCSPLKRCTNRNSWGMLLRLSTILTLQEVELLKYE